ncbi:hypothetical protein [Francisella persica]|uniref:hypothetical protein n=1 Tax=Francisella persica TaxID=954 RepID=UPI001D0FD848|nr:hypothetical protein [Francisella persica]
MYWPETFRNHNPSLVRDKFFIALTGLSLMVIILLFLLVMLHLLFSFSVSMWILFPKYRLLWALLVFLLLITQLLQYFHFTSDLIAGAMLGSIISYCTALTYQQKS